jgi:hypothetical protein
MSLKNAEDGKVAILWSLVALTRIYGLHFYYLFKHWPDCPFPIFLGSNMANYPDNSVKSILAGPDIDNSSNLLKMLNKIHHLWVVLWIEDRVLSAPVDTHRLQKVIRNAGLNQVVYLKFLANPPYALG